MNVRRIYNPVQRKRKRYEEIVHLLNLKPHEKILNIGSGKGYTFEAFNETNPITGMDIFPKEENVISQKNFKYIQRKNDPLPFKDKEFDVVVSIGVLEHIQPEESFLKTCEEIQRVGKKFLVIVPSITTILEPHYGFPFFHLLPLKGQKFLQKNFNLKYIEENQQESDYEYIRYLRKKEWKKLFPSSKIKTYMHIGPLVTNLFIWKD
jgi:cyclopropane fatty-acyl-phospholipid synthase-like methyltransferase